MSKPIEGCPQPEAEIRERAYTPEQLERHAKHCDAVEEHDAARMLRTFAATLRQPTNPHGIGSKLVQGEQAGGLVSKDICLRKLNNGKWIARQGDSAIPELFSIAREAFEAVAPLLRAPGETESKVYACPRCATSMQVDPSAKPRAPAGQGGKPCTCHPDDNPPRPCPQRYALTECRQAALAQNAQEEAAVEIVEWKENASPRLRFFTKVSNLPAGTKLYTHAERARVPATDADIAAWAERHDLSFGGSKIDARSAFEDAETLHLAAAPSLPEGADNA